MIDYERRTARLDAIIARFQAKRATVSKLFVLHHSRGNYARSDEYREELTRCDAQIKRLKMLRELTHLETVPFSEYCAYFDKLRAEHKAQAREIKRRMRQDAREQPRSAFRGLSDALHAVAQPG